ncbi:glutathione S-transferase N-terminal domain-containing protein [Methylococcus capsulatus]|uniref:glutathione S-transferase N-terminal domain-containing protein n=1 Tax=Methylococcus capsulatus TaxID=414 RepID=UPI0002F68C30|nr:glutathione S-transferase N-terminal domain-containing protein [Methylococcus capsulatus]
MSLTLVIGYKNHSSWSLRPWLYRKHHGLAFEEIRIPLYREDPKAEILAHSPAGKVPVLIDGDLAVWDSLAILARHRGCVCEGNISCRADGGKSFADAAVRPQTQYGVPSLCRNA